MARSFKSVVSIDDQASASSEALRLKVTGEANARLSIDAGGKLTWGSGSASGDATLYRSAANALKTDDTFQAALGVITLTTDGAPSSSLADGAVAVDTTNDSLYFRSSSAWQAISNLIVSDGAPSGPVAGDLWFESDTGRTLVYYSDGSSNQWIEIGSASASGVSGADGKIQFSESNTFASDTLLHWDNTNNRLGIGTASPSTTLHIGGDATVGVDGTGHDFKAFGATSGSYALWDESDDALRLVGADLVPASALSNRNACLNPDMKINQRNGGASGGPNAGYVLDQWGLETSGGLRNYNVGAFTLGAHASDGYASPNYGSFVLSSMSSIGGWARLSQKIEDVRTLAEQAVTLSFWAKAASGTPSISCELCQNFGTGGSPSGRVDLDLGQVTLSTSWQRFSVTGTLASLTGKTLGTDANTSNLQVYLWMSAGSDHNARTGSLGAQNNTFDIWGVQIERGSNATPLEVRSHAEELARCQRYYYRGTPGSAYGTHAWGIANSTSTVVALMELPVTFRAGAHTLEYSGTTISNFGATNSAGGLALGSYQSLDRVQIDCGAAAGTPYTVGNPYGIRNNNNTAGYLGVSAEL